VEPHDVAVGDLVGPQPEVIEIVGRVESSKGALCCLQRALAIHASSFLLGSGGAGPLCLAKSTWSRRMPSGLPERRGFPRAASRAAKFFAVAHQVGPRAWPRTYRQRSPTVACSQNRKSAAQAADVGISQNCSLSTEPRSPTTSRYLKTAPRSSLFGPPLQKKALAPRLREYRLFRDSSGLDASKKGKVLKSTISAPC